MRIAFDSQAFMMQSYGGVSRYYIRLAKCLYDMGQQVKIFAALYRNSYIGELPHELYCGQYINHYPAKTTKIISIANNLYSRFEIGKWKPDVAHQTYYSRIRTVPRRCKTVITVYDMIDELFPQYFPTKNTNTIAKRYSINLADHVICISENTKQDLMRLFGIHEKKISVIHLGIEGFQKEEELENLDSPIRRPFLLYVGQRYGYKNFDGFLKAVSASSNMMEDFDIIAFGGSDFLKEELDLISCLGFYPGQVSHKNGGDPYLSKLYSSATALVYPSFYEGFGIPPLEAMVHECPVICSNTSSIPEVVGIAGEYFDPSNIDDIRIAIEKVVYSETRIGSLKEAGKAQLKNYSWEKSTRQTMNVYQSLID